MLVPQAVLTPHNYESEWKLDFVARPVDQGAFTRIIELKKPQIPLVKRTRFEQNPFTAHLYDAIQQLRRYARAFQNEETRARFQSRYKIDVYRPDLHLIAGREWEIELSNRFRDFMKEEHVLLENWDEWHCRVGNVFVGSRLLVSQLGSQDGAWFLH